VWEPGPPDPHLTDGVLHVWRADLDAVSGEVIELLSDDERARAESILSARKAQRWSRGRGVLRDLLGRYLETDPGTLRFRTGAHGKPTLAEGCPGSAAASGCTTPGTAWFSFNMSHSRPLALYALAGTCAVGVDVEVVRRPLDEVAIARRAFGPSQSLRLEGVAPARREREFLRAWVRHEAELKFRGTGIRKGVRESDAAIVWISELNVGPHAAAAVAVERRPRELRCWDWRG
jgi:4'-phosphopantetheinyl transferase